MPSSFSRVDLAMAQSGHSLLIASATAAGIFGFFTLPVFDWAWQTVARTRTTKLPEHKRDAMRFMVAPMIMRFNGWHYQLNGGLSSRWYGTIAKTESRFETGSHCQEKRRHVGARQTRWLAWVALDCLVLNSRRCSELPGAR